MAQLVPSEAKKVRINLGWSHQFQFAGYYAALERGYFLDEGLDVELISEIQEDDLIMPMGVDATSMEDTVRNIMNSDEPSQEDEADTEAQ